jgi:hypothetical protein
MANAPWYLKSQTDATTGASLKHHKSVPAYNHDPSKLESRFERGAKAVQSRPLSLFLPPWPFTQTATRTQGPAAKKYRPGACTNCGAMTHTQKDCLERPRKVGAKYTHRDIAPDEVVHDASKYLNGLQGQGDYDVKRDRWDGYDPKAHAKVIEEYDALEAARRKLREEAIDKGTAQANSKEVAKLANKGKGKGKGKGNGKGKGKGGKGKGKEEDEEEDDGSDEFGSSDESDQDDADEDKYAEAADVAGQKLDTKTRVTVRNLRIREDTAKYLMNLDLGSAYYDPKTRSMREAPNADIPLEEVRILRSFLPSLLPLCSPEEGEESSTSLSPPPPPLTPRPLAGTLCGRQFRARLGRRDPSPKAATLCLAIRTTRSHRPRAIEPDRGGLDAQRVPRTKGRLEGQECRFDPRQVWRRGVPPVGPERVEGRSDRKLCRV